MNLANIFVLVAEKFFSKVIQNLTLVADGLVFLKSQNKEKLITTTITLLLAIVLK